MNFAAIFTPRLEYYTCMIDILGQAGNLDEAEDLIHKMPLQHNDKMALQHNGGYGRDYLMPA